jgi:ABC-type uncharacterized transport system substrate-binding protein
MAATEFFPMEKVGLVRATVARISSIILLFILSGCSIFISPPLDPVVLDYPEAQVDPAPKPAPEPPPPVAPPPVVPIARAGIELRVAVVISDRTPAFVNVATALQEYFDDQDVYDLSDRSLPPKALFGAIAESGANAVVAVGLPAAQAAGKYSSVPVVIGQVFNVTQGDLLTGDIKAVSVLPPIDLQVEAWLKIDPALSNVGAILGTGHEELIAETDRALKKHGINFHYAIAISDRETLYLFNRLIRDIDGFLLFPDNRILSRPVLTEMMGHASRQSVQVAVFNKPLLEMGATFSSESVSSDIAATIAEVLDEIINGDIKAVPSITVLSRIDVQTNPRVLRKLGLDVAEKQRGNTVAGTK